jgi:hypothetical protein
MAHGTTGGTLTPTAPHAWFLDEAGNGSFHLRSKGTSGFEVLELVPSLVVSTGQPKLITRPAASENLHQRWEIWADKVMGTVVEVLSARYGVAGSMADVAGAVQRIADRGDASFEVRNHILGGDPAIGVHKHIVVSYRLDGVAKEQTVTEGAFFAF